MTTAAALIQHAAADGVTLAFGGDGSVRARGNPGAVNRWAPILREHKAEIVAELGDSANEAIPRIWWRLQFTNRGWREVGFAPPVTRAEALMLYPDADSALPVLE